ncbi:MAG: prepilin-type N-terminal cleavage/methylation domain-containing protein [Cyanobacteriota bacterium]|nr:prepilin-type N-terminal cleavage/methylation domain-containing protein [Cyanobacteriota bacterium]
MSRANHRPIRLRSAAANRTGFSLLEVLVAALLLAVGSTVALGLFTAANQLFRSGQTIDNDQNAINTDLAEIQRRNRRFVCNNGSCQLFPSSSADPTENDYTPSHPGVYPPGTTFDSNQLFFTGREAPLASPAIRGLCSFYHPVKYPNLPPSEPSTLIQQYKLIALDSLPAMANGITRSVDITSPAAESPPTPHAYVVTYTKNGQVLRRLRLVPTVAGWCP